MDRSIDWPWSWEEEAEWKAELEERGYKFLETLMDNVVEDSTTEFRYNLDSPTPERPEDAAPEEYFVTA